MTSTESNSDYLSNPDPNFQIIITLNAVGGAGILSENKLRIGSDKKVSLILKHLKKSLHLKDSQQLYLFTNQQFSPAPDETILDVYRNFGDGQRALNLKYAITQAWG